MQIPSDFVEVVQRYGQVFRSAGVEHVERVAITLVMEGLLDYRGDTVEGFERFLKKKVELHVKAAERRDIPFVRPTTLPKDNDELCRVYAKAVEQSVRSVIKYDLNMEEAIQEVWARLFTVDIVSMFLVAAAGEKRLPATMTAEECVLYLGVTWDDWDTFLAESDDAPEAVVGDTFDTYAEFKGTDIAKLDLSEIRCLPRQLPTFSVETLKFEAYLRYSASMHARNLIRTQVRRYSKDGPMQDANVFLTSQGNTGRYRVTRSVREDAKAVDWQASLVSTGSSVEDIADARRVLANMGVTGDDQIERLVSGLGDMASKANSIGCGATSGYLPTALVMLSEGKDPSEVRRNVIRMRRKNSPLC